MRLLLFHIVFCCFFDVLSQSNDLVIKTNRPIINRSDIDLFSEVDEMGIQELDNSIDRIIIGNVKVYSFSEDSIYFRVRHNLPILISGLNNIKSGKIVISKVPRIQYNSIDSLWSSTIKYYNKDSVDYSSADTTIYSSKGRPKDEIVLKMIKINSRSYFPEIIEIPSENTAIYCKPGKFSTTQYTRRVDKFFHYKIERN